MKDVDRNIHDKDRVWVWGEIRTRIDIGIRDTVRQDVCYKIRAKVGELGYEISVEAEKELNGGR